MSLVIVTKKCFLICEDITSITVQQRIEPEYDPDYDDDRPRRRRSRVAGTKASKKLTTPPVPEEKKYVINIAYVPVSRQTGYQPDDRMVDIEVWGEKNTQDLYNEIVKEIREQKPDALYLDKIVEQALGLKPQTDEAAQ